MINKAIIHLDNLEHNIKEIRRHLKPGTKMLVPVKANAYGHGMVECARTAVRAGADFLAVARVDEGVQLRKSGMNARLLMFSLCASDEVEAAVDARITPFVFDAEYIGMFAEAAAKKGITDYPVHLAVDTGMGRIGCRPEDAPSLAKAIQATNSLRLEGMCTHFAVSDSKKDSDIDYTSRQFECFLQATRAVADAGIDPGIRHCCNSAATLDHPEMHLDMVRPGIIVYGSPAGDVDEEYLRRKGAPAELKEVMTLESEVVAVRRMLKGESVSYGRTWTAGSDTDIAVVPLGYGDGFLRRNSTEGMRVGINGKAYPVVGRICMDQMMVDLGDSSGVRRGDKVAVFGLKEDGAVQSAEDLARLTGTISYEMTTNLNSRVERVYIGAKS